MQAVGQHSHMWAWPECRPTNFSV